MAEIQRIVWFFIFPNRFLAAHPDGVPAFSTPFLVPSRGAIIASYSPVYRFFRINETYYYLYLSRYKYLQSMVVVVISFVGICCGAICNENTFPKE